MRTGSILKDQLVQSIWMPSARWVLYFASTSMSLTCFTWGVLQCAQDSSFPPSILIWLPGIFLLCALQNSQCIYAVFSILICTASGFFSYSLTGRHYIVTKVSQGSGLYLLPSLLVMLRLWVLPFAVGC